MFAAAVLEPPQEPFSPATTQALFVRVDIVAVKGTLPERAIAGETTSGGTAVLEPE